MGANDAGEMLKAALAEIIEIEHENAELRKGAKAYNKLMWRIAIALGKAEPDSEFVAVNASELELEALAAIINYKNPDL